MATRSACFLLLLVSISLLLLPRPSAAQFPSCTFDSIYQLGDSISDTGNLIREVPIGAASAFARLPYGQNFFDKATGRCSNGLLMVDYLAKAAGLPLLNPYLKRDADFTQGVNFAVAGSTALDTSSLAKRNILSPVTNSSLNVQLEWFKTHLSSICNSKTECGQRLEMGLFMMGEIGGNDYNYAFFQGKTIDEVQKIVTDVVHTIKNAIREVINLGALRIVVPGNFPIGCFPIYLTAFKSNDSAAYDESKCLKDLNNFAMYHNNQLQQAIEELNRENPDVVVVYADYYNAFQVLLHHASYLGFDAGSVQKACCGTGGDYDFDLTRMCGAPGVTVCPNPERRVSWDGVHPTQKAYGHMAEWLIRDIMPKIHCIALVTPQGWMPWSGEFALSTLYYGEFENSGAGANSSARVTWSSQIPAEHVFAYSVQNFIQGADWIPTSS
ncbi:hypothetical protein HHK36_026532 [Tetracentron sinense]|uniref:Pectinesterase catalytic domain-containing protein n=1 Tax=Tetracentron sinense TaxID=13715 RepID=A0A834YJU1_TETSI|nr:hypothetical protein HHK36_026532 [Tetracentron sinense]